MKKNTLLAGVSALALIVAGCDSFSENNVAANNDTEIVTENDTNRADRIDNDNDPATRTP